MSDEEEHEPSRPLFSAFARILLYAAVVEFCLFCGNLPFRCFFKRPPIVSGPGPPKNLSENA